MKWVPTSFTMATTTSRRAFALTTLVLSPALENNVADNPCLDHYWELFYSATDVCNNALKYINEATFLGDEEKNRYLGEAYFLRAFYYFPHG